ncbi:Uncharacterised protein [Mycobacteroides abscessus subsp. abscessus]|nr:Uncharacterised protein [Mycobacteroides abscessus subsp. abscessus]
MRHLRIRHRVDHHRPVLDDAVLLVLLTDHVAGCVVQEQQWRIRAIGEFDELRGLLRLLAEQHALRVGQDADGITVDVGPPRTQRVAVFGLELVEITVVDDPRDHVARVERDLEIGWDDTEEFFGVVARFPHLCARLPTGLGPVEPRHDPTPDPDRILFVCGVVVGQTRSTRMHLSATEGLVVAFLAGGHLHQRRSAEEHLGTAVDHHDVIAHARDVCPAGRGVSEDQRDRRNPRCRQPCQVTEHPTAGNEHLFLRR